MLSTLFSAIRANPLLLRQKQPDMIRKLQTQATNTDAQGTGNKVTDQEASFATLLEAHGFVFQPKAATATAAAATTAATVATVPGKYYNYQVNGSQRSIDFRAFEHDGTAMTRHVDLDLKHTTSDVFFLNDGWFHKDVVYVVTWDRRTSAPRKKKTSEPATLIALGQDIPSPEESACMDELLAIKKKYNTEFKGCGSLSTYIRFANRYKCDRFTPEETERLYGRILAHSSPSSSSSSASPPP